MYTDKEDNFMFIKLPTPKGDYCVNLLKVLFFYPNKSCTRFEIEDGTIIDFNITFDEVIKLVDDAGYNIPDIKSYVQN